MYESGIHQTGLFFPDSESGKKKKKNHQWAGKELEIKRGRAQQLRASLVPKQTLVYIFLLKIEILL